MSDKGKRGGKHSNERITAEEQRTRRAKKEVVENSVSYDFDNPRLGLRHPMFEASALAILVLSFPQEYWL